MVSFDISSLFTNVPIDETIDIVTNRFFLSSTQFSGFSHVQCRKHLYFAVKNCHFLFNGRLYEQVVGVPMGSPWGPSFANTFLCYHEKFWLDNCPRDFKPLIFRLYVDDCFVIFRCPDHVKPFLDYLNSQHNSIKFSTETEVNNTLPFLDVLIERNNGFSISVYRKPTFPDFSLILTTLSHFLLNVGLFTPFSTDILRYANPTTSFVRKSSSSKIFSLAMGILFLSLTFVLVNFSIMVFSVSAKNYDVSKRVIYFSIPFMGETLPSNPFAVNKTSLLLFSSSWVAGYLQVWQTSV